MDLDDLVRRGKISRIFRARRKITEPNLVSHITQRAAGKEPLFLEDGDFLYLLGRLKEVSKKHSIEIYAFCLMPNHIHILLSPQNEELPSAMKDLFASYAMMFNRKYERKGHLFAGPYRQAVCLDDSYLLAASLYIHMNPVRAGLVPDPRDYRWSTIRLYCDSEAQISFVKPGFVLGILADGKKRQREIYAELLNKSKEIETGDVLEKPDAVGTFRKKLVRFSPEIFSHLVRKNVPDSSGIYFPDDEALERAIKAQSGKKGIRSPGAKKARKFLIEQLIARGYTKKEIAEKLRISRKTVFNSLKLK